jgi:hypothetical protein
MDKSPCANEAPLSPYWAHAALTAGAGVVAGLLLSRKGMGGLAAGIAAVAGAKLIADACFDDDDENRLNDEFAPGNCTSQPIALSPAPMEVLPPEVPSLDTTPEKAGPDWIDHDAIEFSHVVPDATVAAAMLKEKELPLLDDEGLPVAHVAVEPVYPEVPDKKAVDEGPLIWEPGRFIQTHSDATSSTVWFGLLDPAPPASVPAPPQDQPSPPPDTPAPVPESPPPAPTPELIFPPPPPPTLPLEAEPRQDPIPSAPLQIPVVAPKQTTRTALPQPRQTAAVARHERDQATAHAPPGLRLTSLGLPAVRHTQRASQLRSTGAHRHVVSPLAPFEKTKERHRSRRAVLVLSCLLAIVAIFLAVDRWTDGAIFQKLGARPWPQQQDMNHGTSPAPSPDTAAAPQDSSAKRSPWLNAEPAPKQ